MKIMCRWFLGRKYEVHCDELVREKARFTVEYRCRFGHHAKIHYPDKFHQLPTFAKRVRLEVARATKNNDKPSRDVKEGSRLPKIVAIGYRAIYVHGMHLKIYIAEEKKVTFDRVAFVILRQGRSHELFQQGSMETTKNVGWI
jgi:hypothetical protein